jgi:anti-sigma factor ChrR (cupin superfamily)
MINMDFSQRVVINTRDLPWQPSPHSGVLRKPLAREDAERGHATSIVQYAPGASFHQHNHPGGEEILVLEGTFSDATGDFHAGTYFRNPMGFVHAPFSKEGCIILVKLHQFQEGDDTRIAIETDKARWHESKAGLQVLPLHSFNTEEVALVRWKTGSRLNRQEHLLGKEVFVISGELKDEFGCYPAGTWLRMPQGSFHTPFAETETLAWIKKGHLSLQTSAT